jgi:hypothetical protein
MPHWGLQLDVPDRLRAAIAKALDGDFHPGDADQLLALGLLARLGFDDPDFLGRVQSSRDPLALRSGTCSGRPPARPGTTRRSTPRCS